MKYPLIAATALVLISSQQSYAAEQPIETTLVTATRSEQPTVVLPASVQVLTAEQIEMSGAQNLVQVLNAQAGIQIKDSVGNQSRGASISMRGFGGNSANNVLVLVDGRKLNNPSLAAPDLASIALKDVERVEIIQGSAGTLYGDQATGGVINIITKQARELSGHVEVTRGIDDFESYTGSISQKTASGFSYRASVEKRLADNYRDNNEANYENGFLNLGYGNDRFDLFVEAQVVNDELNLAGALDATQLLADRRQADTPNDFSNRDVDTYRTGGSVRFSDEWKLMAEYSDRSTDAAGGFDSPSYSGSYTSSTDVATFSPRMIGEVSSANGPWYFTGGVDWEDATAKSLYLSNFGPYESDIDQNIQDVYAQLIFPVTDAIDVTVGGRHSEFELDNNAQNSSHSDEVEVYQIGASLKLGTDSRLFLRRDESFRWGNADENGATLPGVDYLDVQEATSWELGYENTINSLFLAATVYELTIDNEIVYDPIAGGYGANINLDKSERVGAVLRSVWQARDNLSIEANYSYTDAEFDAGPYQGNTVPFVAESTANLVLMYTVNARWSLYADAQYTGPRYYSGDEANQFGELGGYTVYNASVRFTLDKLYAQLRLNNLTGKEYNGYSIWAPSEATLNGYPAPEQDYQLSVGYQF